MTTSTKIPAQSRAGTLDDLAAEMSPECYALSDAADEKLAELKNKLTAHGIHPGWESVPREGAPRPAPGASGYGDRDRQARAKRQTVLCARCNKEYYPGNPDDKNRPRDGLGKLVRISTAERAGFCGMACQRAVGKHPGSRRAPAKKF